jgi:hypothetical protein
MTAIPDTIEALIPKNCSIGTKKFCVGLAKNISCSALPVNLTRILTPDIEKLLQLNFEDIQPLSSSLTKVTAANIYYCLFSGLLGSLTMIGIYLFDTFFPLHCLANTFGLRILKAAGYLLLGLISAITFIIPFVILSTLKSKMNQLPSWITAEEGELRKLCEGGMISDLISAVLGSILFAVF